MENTQTNVNRTIRRKFERETAIKMLNELQNKIAGANLDAICDDDLEITSNDFNDDLSMRRLLQAVQCGLVYWDDSENCMVQELINPLKSGDLTADKFYYKHKLSIAQIKENNTTNQIELAMRLLSQITGRAIPLIGQLYGTDMEISMGCLSFFGK